jgi:hypothetical protein
MFGCSEKLIAFCFPKKDAGFDAGTVTTANGGADVYDIVDVSANKTGHYENPDDVLED